MVFVERFDNGLTLIVENIPHLESVAYELLIPGGIIFDSPERIGSSLLLAELSARGAGSRDSRELMNAFEESGIRHGESASTNRFSYRGALIADQLPKALELVADMVLRPRFPAADLESVKSIYLQEFLALKDSPSRRCLMSLGSSYYPEPYNRSSMGDEQGIVATTLDEIQNYWAKAFCADGSILSLAGNLDEREVVSLVKRYFSGWGGKVLDRPGFSDLPHPPRQHIHEDSAQMQIGLAYPSAPFDSRHYYAAKVATGVLSGGMFGRLFIEVREKKGLCYSVFARHSAALEYGTITAYAGTTPERANETLEVMARELLNLKGTITQEELDRARANILASIIIGEESPGSRAISNAVDYWLLGRLRPIDEIHQEINKVSLADIDNYLEAFPSRNFALTTLGSRELDSSGF